MKMSLHPGYIITTMFYGSISEPPGPVLQTPDAPVVYVHELLVRPCSRNDRGLVVPAAGLCFGFVNRK